MKRIALSLSIIVAVAAIVSGATFAVFSDQSSILGNTVSTADIDIVATGASNGTTVAKPLVANNLVPGQWSDWARGKVTNASVSGNVKVFMYVDNVLPGISSAACDKVNLKLTTGPAVDDTSERSYVVHTGPLSDYFGSPNQQEVTGTATGQVEFLSPSGELVVQQQAQLDASADDSYQDTDCTWDEVFYAESFVPLP